MRSRTREPYTLVRLDFLIGQIVLYVGPYPLHPIRVIGLAIADARRNEGAGGVEGEGKEQRGAGGDGGRNFD